MKEIEKQRQRRRNLDLLNSYLEKMETGKHTALFSTPQKMEKVYRAARLAGVSENQLREKMQRAEKALIAKFPSKFKNPSIAQCKKLIEQEKSKGHIPTISHYRDNENGMTRGNYIIQETIKKGYKVFYVKNCDAILPFLMSKGFNYSDIGFTQRIFEEIPRGVKILDASKFDAVKFMNENKNKFEKWISKQNPTKTVANCAKPATRKTANPTDKTVMLIKKLDRTATGAIGLSRLSSDEKAIAKSSPYFKISSDFTGDKVRLTEKGYRWLEGKENPKTIKNAYNLKITQYDEDINGRPTVEITNINTKENWFVTKMPTGWKITEGKRPNDLERAQIFGLVNLWQHSDKYKQHYKNGAAKNPKTASSLGFTQDVVKNWQLAKLTNKLYQAERLPVSSLTIREQELLTQHKQFFNESKNGFVSLTRAGHWLDEYYKSPQMQKNPIRKTAKNFTHSDFKQYQKIQLEQLAKMFQGEANGLTQKLIEPDIAPNNKFRLGFLASMKVKRNGITIPIEFDNESMLSADIRKNLWVSGKDSIIDDKSLRSIGLSRNPNGLIIIGDLMQIDYVTAKKFIENGKTVRFYHKLGEASGERPKLAVDYDGFPIILGGNYDIWNVGIVN